MLAALAIAALTLVMGFEVYSGAARLGHRLEMETAAHMLARALMAGDTAPSGEVGQFRWTMARSPAGLRQLRIDWPDGRGLVLFRSESPPPTVEGTP